MVEDENEDDVNCIQQRNNCQRGCVGTISQSASQRELLEEFIEIYRCEPCLWLVKSKDNHNRIKREAAYVRLIDKLKEIEPKATKQAVINKINSIRCTYRKENEKVNESKSGSGADDVYEPKLWYYSLLTFVDDQEIPKTSRCNLEIENETNPPETTDSTESSSFSGNSTPLSTRAPKKKSEVSLTKDVLLSVQSNFKRPANQDDRFDLFGKSISAKLRDVNKQQRILAEKIISDTLFEAEMGNLTVSHKLMVPSGKLTPNMNPGDLDALWEDLKISLNSCGDGPLRSVHECKNVSKLFI
ncbi:hypothetical protein NQ314_011981 [Rhamnusium bicolor]|uniref:MADF domain-containing protein n=1 Tax=Rhamnusium bicolor TaxID=1586634 RepID=A0AAV8XES2_9CUCU|nr:hypothetical protein NQ314_011981 [Rhamnusium bicolor]